MRLHVVDGQERHPPAGGFFLCDFFRKFNTLPERRFEPRADRYRDRIKLIILKLLKEHGQVFLMLALGEVRKTPP